MREEVIWRMLTRVWNLWGLMRSIQPPVPWSSAWALWARHCAWTRPTPWRWATFRRAWHGSTCGWPPNEADLSRSSYKESQVHMETFFGKQFLSSLSYMTYSEDFELICWVFRRLLLDQFECSSAYIIQAFNWTQGCMVSGAFRLRGAGVYFGYHGSIRLRKVHPSRHISRWSIKASIAAASPNSHCRHWFASSKLSVLVMVIGSVGLRGLWLFRKTCDEHSSYRTSSTQRPLENNSVSRNCGNSITLTGIGSIIIIGFVRRINASKFTYISQAFLDEKMGVC